MLESVMYKYIFRGDFSLCIVLQFCSNSKRRAQTLVSNGAHYNVGLLYLLKPFSPTSEYKSTRMPSTKKLNIKKLKYLCIKKIGIVIAVLKN